MEGEERERGRERAYLFTIALNIAWILALAMFVTISIAWLCVCPFVSHIALIIVCKQPLIRLLMFVGIVFDLCCTSSSIVYIY